MRRSLAILTILTVVFSILPLLPIAPVPEVFGASQTYTCTGSNDQVGINGAINAAGAGDTVTIHNGPTFCDIQFPGVNVVKGVILTGDGKDVTYLKGPQVA